jgi:phospholipid/cholesterol/gamma-HCH transport system ATP-binding protein
LFVIIGYSGTGKSVLLKHILGLLKPSEGSIHVLGEDLSQMDDAQLAKFRTNFGVLFQHAALFDDMTVLENVCFPLTEHRRELKKSEIIDLAIHQLKAVQFEEKHYDKLPSELSGGMRKRVGLARALALDPDIMVYDEPTTGLDPIRTEMVDDLILSTHKHRPGITSVIVSHDLHAAFRLGDTIAMLDSGSVLLKGPVDEFFKSDIDLVQRFLEKGMKGT